MNRHGLKNKAQFVSRVLIQLICVAVFAAINCDCLQAQTGDSNDQATIAAPDAIPSAISSEMRADRLPRVTDGRFLLPQLAVLSTATDQIGNGRTPPGFRVGAEVPLQSLPEDGGDAWNWTVATWAAPNTFSHPRYFEDRMLERHGHERVPMAQPIVSGMRFFAQLPMLPYLMTVRPPCDCEYSLGYYRPGSCAPVMRQRPPLERRAVVAQTAAIAAGIIAIP